MSLDLHILSHCYPMLLLVETFPQRIDFPCIVAAHIIKSSQPQTTSSIIGSGLDLIRYPLEVIFWVGVNVVWYNISKLIRIYFRKNISRAKLCNWSYVCIIKRKSWRRRKDLWVNRALESGRSTGMLRIETDCQSMIGSDWYWRQMGWGWKLLSWRQNCVTKTRVCNLFFPRDNRV